MFTEFEQAVRDGLLEKLEKEKAVDAGKTVADKMADKAFGLAEKTDDFKNKMHAMASEAKK